MMDLFHSVTIFLYVKSSDKWQALRGEQCSSKVCCLLPKSFPLGQHCSYWFSLLWIVLVCDAYPVNIQSVFRSFTAADCQCTKVSHGQSRFCYSWKTSIIKKSAGHNVMILWLTFFCWSFSYLHPCSSSCTVGFLCYVYNCWIDFTSCPLFPQLLCLSFSLPHSCISSV